MASAAWLILKARTRREPVDAVRERAKQRSVTRAGFVMGRFDIDSRKTLLTRQGESMVRGAGGFFGAPVPSAASLTL
ncbi:hypothetical protein [Bradyrhizobium sp. STM 3809]|uniref:hypothetical protein n=1 Tax=Bradyrhizobium sp. STM 3809 TaxID=551936 RepID=UPI001F0A7209|nr:hypothetical protein [Bradyrhizobium sp. STM 3809]